MLLASAQFHPEATMTRSNLPARDVALGGVAYTVFLGAWFSALVLWSRRCEAHKHHVG